MNNCYLKKKIKQMLNLLEKYVDIQYKYLLKCHMLVNKLSKIV